MTTGYDDDDELPYEEGPRHIDDFNEDLFEDREQAQAVYDWFQGNWHPNEGGFSPDDVFDRLTNVDNILYDEDGEIIGFDYAFEGSP